VKTIDRIEAAFNRVSDLDWLWQPFLFVRPKQTQRFSFWRVLLCGVIVTVVAPGLVMLLRVAMNRPVFFEWVIYFVVASLVFTCAFFGIVAYFWNRRATRLARGE
jgi:hypothetical protein